MDAQDLADLERATGLLLANERDWSQADYDAVIAYLRRKALMPTAFIGHAEAMKRRARRP
jgi:hypothetical protein